MSEAYLHTVSEWRNGELRRVNEFYRGTESVIIYERPHGGALATTERVQVEPDGSLTSATMFGDETVHIRVIRSGNKRNFFLSRKPHHRLPTIMVETIKPSA